MSIFEKYLSIWVALAMVAGIALGNLSPALVGTIAAAEVAIGLGLVIALFRNKEAINVDDFSLLKG